MFRTREFIFGKGLYIQAWYSMYVRMYYYVCMYFLLLIKQDTLPWVILHAVGIQLGSISVDTVAIITRCRQSLYSLYSFTAL